VTVRLREILETSLYADDLEAAERFYADVLGLEIISCVPGRHVFFRCGDRVFLVFNPARTLEGGRIPPHGTSGPGHAAFAVTDAELAEWRARLTAHGVEVEMEVEWPGGGHSLYFRDPAGNSLELGTPAIWRIPEERIFRD
jgi:catechol 2,3-dioxygenase-like lactoylglutathione lyase family enzyme